MVQAEEAGVLLQGQPGVSAVVQHVGPPHGVHVVRAPRVVRAAQPCVHQRLVPVAQDVAVAQLVVVVLLAEGVDVGVGVGGVDVGGVVEVHGLLRGVGRGEVGRLEVPGRGVRQAGGGGKGGGVAGHQVAEAAMAAHQVGAAVLVTKKKKKRVNDRKGRALKHVKHVKTIVWLVLGRLVDVLHLCGFNISDPVTYIVRVALNCISNINC